MAYDSKNEKTEFSDVKFESHASQERIEDVSHAKEHADQLAELSGIEATAASRAAWLIAITISIGNLLFGTCPSQTETFESRNSQNMLSFAKCLT